MLLAKFAARTRLPAASGHGRYSSQDCLAAFFLTTQAGLLAGRRALAADETAANREQRRRLFCWQPEPNRPVDLVFGRVARVTSGCQAGSGGRAPFRAIPVCDCCRASAPW